MLVVGALKALVVMLFFGGFAFLAGCDGGKKTADQEAPPGAIEKTFERGPVQVVVRLDNPTPSIADRITLELEVTSGEGYNIEMPGFGERLEQFGIVDFSATQPELLEDGKVRQTKSYILEPFLSGEYVIPPMTIGFRKEGGSEDEAHEIVTEELKVVVSSLLPEDAENLEIHEIAPPVALPNPRPAWLWPSVAGLAAVVLAAVLMLVFKRRTILDTVVPRRPAHEIAFDDLERLVGEDLPGAGRIKEFYQRISDILRHYIENRFGLRAPERTTEEFLAELGAGDALAPVHQPLLGNFLKHCDLVKFAEHQPGIDDIQNTFDSCKDFIIATREDAPTRVPAS